MPLAPRRRYVTKADLRKYGVTIDSAAWSDTAVHGKTPKPHAEECRTRTACLPVPASSSNGSACSMGTHFHLNSPSGPTSHSQKNPSKLTFFPTPIRKVVEIWVKKASPQGPLHELCPRQPVLIPHRKKSGSRAESSTTGDTTGCATGADKLKLPFGFNFHG